MAIFLYLCKIEEIMDLDTFLQDPKVLPNYLFILPLSVKPVFPGLFCPLVVTGEKDIEVGTAVKFALSSKKGDRLKALGIGKLDISQETYNIGKKYVGSYSHVIGTTKRDYISKDFQKVIHDLFLSSDEGKSCVIKMHAIFLSF